MNEIDFFIEQLDEFKNDPNLALVSNEFDKLRIRINQFIQSNSFLENIYDESAFYFLRLYNDDFVYDNPLLGGPSKLCLV